MARKRKCGNCGKREGHYASTCPNKKKVTVKRGSIRRYSSTGSVTRSQRGRSWFGQGSKWLVLYHGGRTGATQHDKTWAIKIVKKGSGWTVITRHGRRTGQKNETTRAIMSKEAAEKLRKSLINKELRKGYQLAGANRK